MSQLLQLFILIPLLAFLVSLLIPRKKETLLSLLAIGTTGLQLAGVLTFIVFWILDGHPLLDIKHIVLYHSETFEFFIDFYFDTAAAVFSSVGAAITLLVSIFSRYYLHRDEGFKRFFNTLLLFFLGYNLVVFGGNFETLFIGWEILGFCSFLLIGFYRDRYLPVKNAMKVISVYRLGDICLMLAMWMCHHLFHENITFHQIADPAFIAAHHPDNTSLLIFTAVMIVAAAAAKSAMLPFSSWLPRAMEGPTTSSAVFYGSLSVHLGAFLLIRTYPFWESMLSVKIVVIVLGLATSLVATTIARVQSTVKTQIAYSSITQIGLIFVEIALGFHTLALVHFAGNAFLRTYQLLVSPSVLSYEIHDMVFNFTPQRKTQSSAFTQKIKNAVYMLSIKEWNLDATMHSYLWSPFKWVGRITSFMVKKVSVVVLTAFCLLGLVSFMAADAIPDSLDHLLPVIFSILGLILVLTAFAERGDARKAWLFIFGGQLFITLSISLNEHMPIHQAAIYLSGVVTAALVGFVCLTSIREIDRDIRLNRYHGYSRNKPVTAFLFLLCCLSLIGFPFTPTFVGIDLLFTHIHQDQLILIISTSISFIFIELAVLRLYSRVFLGANKKNDHPIAYRSS